LRSHAQNESIAARKRVGGACFITSLPLYELIKKIEETERVKKASPRKQHVKEQTLDNKTYRLEGIRCGKENCKCARGKVHGPYWYSYSGVKDKVTSQYIGKKLPKDIEKKLKDRKGK